MMSHVLDRSFVSPNKKIAGILAFAGWLVGFQPAAAQESGKQIFQQMCAACHSIGGGRVVGPDLAAITDKRPEDWLIRYIKSQDAVLKAGDKIAQAIWEEYKMPMPDQALSDSEIKAVLAHIKATGGSPMAAQDGAASQGAGSHVEPTPDEIRLGQQLFEGSVRLARGGPACNACHDVNHPAVTGGGILAKDLTTSFSSMGAPGVSAMLSNAPFPVMRVAYEAKPLNDAEVKALVGFLQQADKEHASQRPRSHGWMFFAGAGGVVVLLGLFSVLGRRRKKLSVNQDIYDRQLRSE